MFKVVATKQMVPVALTHEPLVASESCFLPYKCFFFFPLDSQSQFLLLATKVHDLIQEPSRLLVAEKSHHELQPLPNLENEAMPQAKEWRTSCTPAPALLRASLNLW